MSEKTIEQRTKAVFKSQQKIFIRVPFMCTLAHKALNLFSLLNLVHVVLRCFISQETRKLLILQFDKILSIPTGPKMNI